MDVSSCSAVVTDPELCQGGILPDSERAGAAAERPEPAGPAVLSWGQATTLRAPSASLI